MRRRKAAQTVMVICAAVCAACIAWAAVLAAVSRQGGTSAVYLSHTYTASETDLGAN